MNEALLQADPIDWLELPEISPLIELDIVPKIKYKKKCCRKYKKGKRCKRCPGRMKADKFRA